MGQFLVKEVARDHQKVSLYMGTALGMRLVMAVVVFAVIVVVANLIGYSPEARLVMYLAAATTILLAFVRVMTSVLNGLENMTWPALAEVVSKLLVVGLGIALLVQGMGVVAYSAVLLVAAGVNLGINAVYVGRRFPLSISLRLPQVKALLIGGAPFLLMGFLLDIYNQLDVVMLRFFTTDAVVGWYAAASQLYHAADMLPIALTSAMLPTMARMHFQSALAMVSVARKSIVIGAVMIVPIGLGMSLLSKEIIATLPYPDVFSNSIPLLTILALSVPITAFLMILGTIAAAVDRQRAWALALTVTVLVDVALNAAAIPYFQRVQGNGGIGAAVTTLVCETFMVLVGIRLMPRGVIDRRMAMAFLKVAIAGGAMVLAGLLARVLGLGTGPVVAAAAITYTLLVLATRAVTISDLLFVKDSVFQRRKTGRPALGE